MNTKFERLIDNTATAAVLFLIAFSAILMTGCGPHDPADTELDRIPDVPPASRGTDGGGMKNPAKAR